MGFLDTLHYIFSTENIVGIVISQGRKQLKERLKLISPGLMNQYIRENRSLWDDCGQPLCGEFGIDLKLLSPELKRNIVIAIDETAMREYGSFEKMIRVWIKEDNPELYSMYLNVPGSDMWLKEQIDTIRNKILES